MSTDSPADASAPHVVIVGGGFGGLAAAKALHRSNVRVALIDRENHHLFQPLLYQVATSVLTPGRSLLGSHRNTRVIAGDVTGVRTAERQVLRSRHGVSRCGRAQYLATARF